jgi:hypothetical protein
MRLRFTRYPRFFSLLLTLVTLLTPLAVTSRASAQLSETERKAAARAAYTEGVKLQEEGKAAEALSRFESAQKLFDAPTHQLRIAQCQALTGRLVEAAETYELLSRKNLGANAPEAFTDAQQRATSELKDLRARIPTLKVTVTPAPQTLRGLQVTVNSSPMPSELLSIARPVNPGTYRLNAAAQGYRLSTAPIDVVVAEREQKSQELALVPGQGAPVVAPVPPPYSPQPGPYPPQQQQAPPAQAPPPAKPESSSIGLLLGLRLGALIPGGGVYTNTTSIAGASTTTDVNFDTVATAGGAFGLDAMFRFARIMLIGGTVEFGSLGDPNKKASIGTGTTPTAGGLEADSSTTSYFGANLGIVSNPDKVAFYGELGAGRRAFSQTYSLAARSGEISVSGAEFGIGAGLWIPAGPLRIVPKASVHAGSFSKVTCSGDINCAGGDFENSATHTMIFVGVAGFYHLDLGSKK